MAIDSATLDRPNGSGSTLGYNKLCEIEDFNDQELTEIIDDVFAHEIRQFPAEYVHGVPDSKQWEIGMSIRALRHFGALRSDANILGVGAGTEATIFYLTKHAGQVFATDLYLNPGVWGDVAPTLMLAEPEVFAPYEFDRHRLVVQHMDGRSLRYSDNTFDGIFSSGSIEHFGKLEFVANAAYEMGRVLKPGGILALATEFKLAGPPGGLGWDTGTILFGREQLVRYIIEASGLEPVDELATEVSSETMRSKRELTTFLSNTRGKIGWRTKVANYPNLILVHEGYVFCSVHMTLRKPDQYPLVPNAWAKPSHATTAAVEELSQGISVAISSANSSTFTNLHLSGAGSATTQADGDQAVQGITPGPNMGAQANVRAGVDEFNRVLLSLQHRLAERLPEPLSFSYRTLRRVRKLGMVLDAQSRIYPALAEYQAEMDNRLTATDRQLAVQTTTVAALPERVQAISSTQETITDRVSELSRTQDEVSEDTRRLAVQTTELNHQLRQMATQHAELSQQLRELAAQNGILTQQVATLQDGQTATTQQLGAFAEAQATMARQVRLGTSYDRLRKLRNRAVQPGDQETEQSFHLTDDDLVMLLQQLEQDNTSLRAASSVDLSIQDARAEERLITGATYFGDRLSAKPPTYRLPNDAWYHLDFTPDWNRAILFENAQGKLSAGGHFMLVTNIEHDEAPATEGLQIISTQAIALPSGEHVRVFIWQRTSPADEAATEH